MLSYKFMGGGLKEHMKVGKVKSDESSEGAFWLPGTGAAFSVWNGQRSALE